MGRKTNVSDVLVSSSETFGRGGHREQFEKEKAFEEAKLKIAANLSWNWGKCSKFSKEIFLKQAEQLLKKEEKLNYLDGSLKKTKRKIEEIIREYYGDKKNLTKFSNMLF